MAQHLLLSALNNGTATTELGKADVTSLSVSGKGVPLPEAGSAAIAIPAHHPSEPLTLRACKAVVEPASFGGCHHLGAVSWNWPHVSLPRAQS